MKRLFSFAILVTILSLNLVSALCINSADDYAVEVVLNKPEVGYNLDSFKNSDNVLQKDNQYIMNAYNSYMILILQKEADLTCGAISGLSVRLQIPVTADNKNLPVLKFASTITKTGLNLSNENYNGWQISCIVGDPIPQCEFKKDKTDILASLISTGKYEITTETNEELKSCSSCDGRCISASESKCIPKQLKESIEDILKHAGLINSFEDLFLSYRVISISNIAKQDLVPESANNIDWKKALNQELTNLNMQGIISISLSDISEISELAKQGAAGVNSRIVFDGNKWEYYSKTNFPALTKLVNCREYPRSLVPTGAAIGSQKIPAYYLVPIIFTSALVFLFLILIIIARISQSNHKKSRIKPITSLAQT